MVRRSKLIIYLMEIILIIATDRDGYIHESKWSTMALVTIHTYPLQEVAKVPLRWADIGLLVLNRGCVEAIVDNTSRLVASSLLMNGIYFQSRIRMSLGLDVLPGV